jgi:hypothetical protein
MVRADGGEGSGLHLIMIAPKRLGRQWQWTALGRAVRPQRSTPLIV